MKRLKYIKKYMNRIIFLFKNMNSFFINLKVFDYKTAFKLPILVSRDVKLVGLYKGCFVLTDGARPGSVRLGMDFGAPGIWQGSRCGGYIDVSEGGRIFFGSNIVISKGFTLKSTNGAVLSIANGFFSNPYLKILCKKKISIGENALLGWNITINDGDGHSIIDLNSTRTNDNKEIIIGNHVWISANASVLKGAEISDNSVVGYSSVIGKKFQNGGVIIAGSYPGKVVKENIMWEP